MSEVDLGVTQQQEPDEQQPTEPTRASARRTRTTSNRGWVVGGLLTVLGIALFVAATTMFPIDWSAFFGALVAVVLIYQGLARIGRQLRGPQFDLLPWACALWLVLLIGAAVLAPLLPLPEYRDVAKTLSEPSMARPDLLSQHWLGTNNFGLDLFARIIHGARTSLLVAVLAVLIGLVVGGGLGLVAGFFRRGVDLVVGVLTNAVLAIPPLILLIALATVLPRSTLNLAGALSLLAMPTMVRMARANTLTFAKREFVLAARSMGATNVRLMVREILPNVLLPLLSYSMIVISALIVAESSLSFLGLGVRPPDPTWGNMIAEGEGNVFRDNPHIVLVPGMALFLTVFSFNLVGEKAREIVDPRQSKSGGH